MPIAVLHYYLSLLRPWQWYKNLVVFIAIIFSGRLLEVQSLIIVFLAFIALCFVSSANYIINDIFDRKRDLEHPQKKNRPIAAGRISVKAGLIGATLLLAIGFLFGYYLDGFLNFFLTGIVFLTTLYTVWLRNEPIADIILISANFVLRALAGAVVISARISPWLIVGTFFLALFLASAKRYGELVSLKKGVLHRTSLVFYTPDFTRALMTISTALFLTAYTLASFLGEHQKTIITMPFFMYGVLRFYSLTDKKHSIAQNPHLLFFDLRFVIAGILWFLSAILALYI